MNNENQINSDNIDNLNVQPLFANQNDTNNNDVININDDTETMNNQLENHLKKVNSNKNIDETKQNKKVIHIDKEILKALIIEWLSIDDQIKSYRDTIRDLADEKKQYESQLLELMDALKQDKILSDRGCINRAVKKSSSPLTPELIKTTLTEILKCSHTADTYTNHIMEKRLVKETVNLKREVIKGNKNNNIKNKSRNKKIVPDN